MNQMENKVNRFPGEKPPKFEKGVSLLTWAYNEEELIGGFLENIDRLLSDNVTDYEIIVVDDGSTDRTGAIIREMQEKIPRIKLLVNDRNRNVGYSMKRAFAAASKEYLFWQTVDWAYDIKMLRLFLEQLKTHDVVAGVRYEPVLAADGGVKTAKSMIGVFTFKHLRGRSDDFYKAIVSTINYTLIRLLFKAPLSDFQNVVFYPTRLVQSIILESNSAFTNPEILIQSFWKGASIIEVPISFIPRQAGTAKGVKVKAVAAAVSDIIRLWFKWMVRGHKSQVSPGKVIPLIRSQWPEC